MELLSAKKTADHFPISERRMQDLLSLSDTCRELSISTATGRNWVKLGKLQPVDKAERRFLFERTYVEKIKNDIADGKNTALKSRRNKKYVSGNDIYHSYISDTSKNMAAVQRTVDRIREKGIIVTDDLMRAIIAECAIQIILDREGEGGNTNCLCRYLHGELKNELFFLVDDLTEGMSSAENMAETYSDLLSEMYIYEEGEDILGLLYISLKNLCSRKATGAYYTPTAIVKKMCFRLFSMNEMSTGKILDPCCGTGNFLLQLPARIGFEQVYGYDIDPVSVKIARINFALKYHISNPSIICSHIRNRDYLLSGERREKFDSIIGNPPWGYVFSEDQKKQLSDRYRTAEENRAESYDLFVERALTDLKRGGVLSFVLPEAILNVKNHRLARQILLERSSFQYLEFLGNVFDKVQCPCIILQTVAGQTDEQEKGVLVSDSSREFYIQKRQRFHAEYINFSATDEEYGILEKLDHIPGKMTLFQNAVFALGIVTGRNRDYISQTKTEENEIVLKGSDLYKFRMKPSGNYIVFRPESFQQVAPSEYYRAPEKLLYRFICNQLVFAYDNKQTLSLNSCNILIPKIPGINMKYVSAILNSRMAQFYFKKQFGSIKVLRSHLEKIPIPFPEEGVQEKIVCIVDRILATENDTVICGLYDELDLMIAGLYGLDNKEYGVIQSSMENENLFLG